MRKFFALLIFVLFIVSGVYASDMRFIQLSDIRYTDANKQVLSDAISEINKEKDVEFVVFTGDNLKRPSKQDLESFLKVIKKINSPVYIVLGDKDVNKYKDLGKQDYVNIVHKNLRSYKPKTSNYVFEKQGVVFIVLDGSKEVITSTVGYYRDDILAWLDEQLKKTEGKNVVILQHFPIIPPAEKEMYYTYKPENYLKILAANKNIKAVVSGHFGVNKEITKDGVVHISTSGLPYYRVIDILDSDTENPVIWAQLKKLGN